ncbi:MAG TPA: helix-turn-helix transcriptional regulator [Candidatus Ornithocaccomicrobium faecavium]|uniref:Helix-turn-helix transcriptional regulator n=1 Tax=Candidatus Ornithocaccomicrobium faecavium TaxID=2840890 RepID=A0A9D1PA10_9FIRM|nr:helix-turn-helix transcriptional regulator [Clostridiales bacterium]HIV28851.1 helix-turn-helix transcriptional regulator [Candidatus Ornithocaccomicrobium faecavium]
MECLDQRPISSEEWELLYNHMPICEALVREGVDAAAALFRRRVEILAGQTSGPPGQETAFVLLTSLNRSLYDFLLLEFGVSLAQCCYRHRAHACDIHSACAILRAARAMLEDYAAGLRHSRANRPHIEKACAYIRAHLAEDLSLERVCAAVFLSKSYLCQIFKSLLGCTFGEYVKQQRILRARTLLASTGQSIEEIAAACGFASPTYFATVFKSAVGMTPSAFRQSLR